MNTACTCSSKWQKQHYLPDSLHRPVCKTTEHCGLLLLHLNPCTSRAANASCVAQAAEAKAANTPIKVTVFNDGSIRDAVKDVTTSMDVTKLLDKKLAKAAVSAKVDGKVWDLMRPLEGDCTVQILTFEEAEGKDVSSQRPTAWFLSVTPGVSPDKGQRSSWPVRCHKRKRPCIWINKEIGISRAFLNGLEPTVPTCAKAI